MEAKLQKINHSFRSFRFYQYHIDELFHTNSPIDNIFITANSQTEIKTIIAHLAIQFHISGRWDWVRLDTDEEINKEYLNEYGKFDAASYYHYLTQVIKPYHRIIFGQYIDQITPLIDYKKSALIVALPITFNEIFQGRSIKKDFCYWLKSKRHSNIKISEKMILSLLRNSELE